MCVRVSGVYALHASRWIGFLECLLWETVFLCDRVNDLTLDMLCFSPVLVHGVRHRPFLVVPRMSSRGLNILVLVLGSLARPRYPLVRAGCVHDMLLLEVRMRATRGHILQEVVMHVIGIILEKNFPKKKITKTREGIETKFSERNLVDGVDSLRRM